MLNNISFKNTANDHKLLINPEDAAIILYALDKVQEINAPVHKAISIQSIHGSYVANFILGTCVTHLHPALCNKQVSHPNNIVGYHNDISEQFSFQGITTKVQNEFSSTIVATQDLHLPQKQTCSFAWGIVKSLYQGEDNVICISEYNVVEASNELS